MKENLQEANKSVLIQKIIDLLTKKFPSQKKDLSVYIEAFYADVSYENLKKLPLETLVQGLADLWEFYQQRPKNEPKFKVYFWSPEHPSVVQDRVVVAIYNDNMSFLVDSLSGFLARHGLKPRLMIHPIYKALRDGEGHLQKLLPKEATEEAPYESFIYCEIVEDASPEKSTFIEKNLPTLLKDIRLANQDWPLMRKKLLEIITEVEKSAGKLSQEQPDEVIKFMQWVEDEHFTLLGYCDYDLSSQEGRLVTTPRKNHELGIMRDKKVYNLDSLFQGVTLGAPTIRYLLNPTPILINKTSLISNIHRSVPMDVIGVKQYDDKGKVVGLHLFIGLFTSIAYDSSARDIPLLRKKVSEVIKSCGFSETWHDGKALAHILDSLPRDELFQATISELAEISLAILRLQDTQRVALFVRYDKFDRFISCLVYIPRERFDSELCDQIGQILSQEFGGETSLYKAQFGSLDFARVHYTVTIPGGIDKNYNLSKIEAKLIQAAQSWADHLKECLNSIYSEFEAASLFRRYREAFSKGYQENFLGEEALKDILEIEEVYKNKNLRGRLYRTDGQNLMTIKLKIYNPSAPLPLSNILPILENLDLKVISEVPYKISPASEDKNIWIHDFEMESRGQCRIDLERIRESFIETLLRIHEGHIENDGFNRLVLRANLNWRQCEILRAYCRYLRQLQIPFSQPYIENTLVTHPTLTSHLVEFFEKRFDPSIAKVDKKLLSVLHEAMDKVESPDDDRILRRYFNLVQATVRTNYFQKNKDGSQKSYISFKFDCARLLDLPLPRPLYEIFVHSKRMEAVHLRGGKVARGGIRWSDRLEDFRTEVLGLMKAQMTKNTVIVPVGSKGGFVIKTPLTGLSREGIQAEGVQCYKTMIQGMLDLTDNLVKGKIVHPTQTVCWDEEDPYLVVAADKGTATFSDYANEISQAYGFWLDDAFASGGSTGYDHKKIAITARGAWESVKRHFRELNIDMSKTPLTVVGVGDMSGDVFGNGMLLSNNLKLIGAFNHMHIFIDPQPDPKVSYKERKRLFNLSRSTWADYNPELISKGGGVFDRKAKELKLSPEIRELLQIEEKILPPNELIRRLLTYSADLLWFGGIGTFIKSSQETHNEVGDRTNDAIRVNAKDLRCKVIGEGANLGVTQLGRIEFARKLKGKINTDAIDNSGGVDCSDHEVNIKILLAQALEKHKISREERNRTLEKMTDEVAKLVLKDNYSQGQAISLVEFVGPAYLEKQIKLMRQLEKEGKLNRSLEFLPDDTALTEYQTHQTGLVRPEIAVILAYAKISLYQEISRSALLEDPYFERSLIRYFPKTLQENYRSFILHHPLRREIIGTLSVNTFINTLGPTFMIKAKEKVDAPAEQILKGYYIIQDVFDLDKLWQDIEELDEEISATQQLQIYQEIVEEIKRLILWLLKYYPLASDIPTTTHTLKQGFEAFLSNLSWCLGKEGHEKFHESIDHYIALGANKALAKRLSLLKIASGSPDILLIAMQTDQTVPEVAALYFMVGARFSFYLLQEHLRQIKTSSSWNRMALEGLQEDFSTYQRDLTIQLIRFAKKNQISFEKGSKLLFQEWVETHPHAVSALDHMIGEAAASGFSDFSSLMVIGRYLRHLSSI